MTNIPWFKLFIISLSILHVKGFSEEEFFREQATGLNCTAYTSLFYSSLVYPSVNNTTAVSEFIFENWNCSASYGAQPCEAGLYSVAGAGSCSMQCPPKYYCPGNGSALVCPPGTYSLGGAAYSCSICSENYYCVHGEQIICNPGFLSSVGSNSCTIPCPSGYQCKGNGQKEICPTTYYSNQGSENCTLCEAGYKCPTLFQHEFCEPNSWSLPGSITCTLPCPAGVICPGNGKMECTVCRSDQYTVRLCSDEGDTICNTTCPPGMFGAFYTNGFCRQCPMGMQMQSYGASVCSSCTTGTYANTTGTISCPTCPHGSSTSDISGFVNCVQENVPLFEAIFHIEYVWSNQSIQSIVGTESPNQSIVAVNTAMGTWMLSPTIQLDEKEVLPQFQTETCTETKTYSQLGYGRCQDCSTCGVNESLVSSCTIESNTVCTPACPNGSISTLVIPYENRILCTLCAKGKYSLENECRVCNDGFYASQVGSHECEPCPGPYFTTSIETGYTQCYVACQPSPGQFCPISTGVPATCPAGYYCTGDVNNQKTECPIGTYNPNFGASSVASCLVCDAFKVAATAASTQCHLCQAGTIYGLDANNVGVCTACPQGSSSQVNSTSCSSCQAGEYSSGGGTCKLCRPGSYVNAVGASACTPCPTGTYTYSVGSGGAYTAIWGASTESQCTNLPLASSRLICLPGTRMQGSICSACPIGYYCPIISTSENDPNAVRVCPSGSMSSATGAIISSDCSTPSILQPFLLEQCSISTSDIAALSGKTISSMTTSASTNVIFFTTATAVFRLFLIQSSSPNNVELLAGSETETGPANNAVGSAARFTLLTAVAVDYDGNEATLAVVGDGNTVRMVRVFNRQVTLLGNPGDVQSVGGIALRRDSGGSRIAYVSDKINHKIMAFDLENLQSYHFAGPFDGSHGLTNGPYLDASFWEPRGLAFLERSMNSSKILLIADSRNNRIRALDTDTRIVTTWYEPLDLNNPELSNPISLSVTNNVGPQVAPMIYITEGNKKVKVIQFPNSADTTIKILSEVILSPSSVLSDANLQIGHVVPHGEPVSGASNSIGYKQLIALNIASNTIRSLVQDVVAVSTEGGGSIAGCHLPCPISQCGALNQGILCGNSFLDSGEACDNGNAYGGGCNAACNIKQNYACPVGLSACVDPCPAYNYSFTNTMYCEPDCLALTPRPGYTINNHCVETDIDECVMGTDNCTKDAMCVNIPGSFLCTCSLTYFGDGYTCKETAFAVYTVLEIPQFTRSSLDLAESTSNPATLASKKSVINNLKNAYSSYLMSVMPAQYKIQSSQFTYSMAHLALMYTQISLDPNTINTARIEVSTLFETATFAAAAAAASSKENLQTALSQALFSTDTDVNVRQAVQSRPHKASSFSGGTKIDGWGMNITSVSYNRTCAVEGVQPRGGCWQVEMIYMGGPSMPRSNEDSTNVKNSKNVLYIPRIDRDPTSLAALKPTQSMTMTSGIAFPCDTSAASAFGSGITSKATACCLRNFNTTYRPHARFNSFLNSAEYTSNVPADFCSNGKINETFPNSDVVFLDPENAEDGSINDLVVGKLEGMPNSEVRLLETLDYSVRMFRVLLVLEEGDLRTSASMVEGNVGTEYSMTFFVGLANFRSMGSSVVGSGGSVMVTRNVQQFITVRKSNILTISSYGANQDPLVTAVDMQLVRVKVTDYFNPTKYLYFLRPLFTIPDQFRSPDEGGIVPVSGIRVLKTKGAVVTTDPNWMQACSSEDGNYIYNNQSLRTLVQNAQKKQCVQSNLQMCSPPANANDIVSFGVPLPEDLIHMSEMSYSDPWSIVLQFMINAKDSKMLSNVRSTLTLSVDLTPLGFMALCEELSASQNLADIISGNIYIGVASTEYEWNNMMMKKTNIDVPGSTPSNSFDFNTTTVQGAVMTFAALGDPNYFEDARYMGQYVNIHDIITVHFLEPLGNKNGASPSFDAAKAMFLAGTAFVQKNDPVTRNVWLEPSAALLDLCPYRARPGRMTCLTRIDSTIKNNMLVQNPKTLVEIRTQNTTTISNMQTLISEVMLEGGVNDYTRNMGKNFTNQLITKLNLNNRYRRGYVVNPVIDWSFEAMQETQPGSTPFTVCTKIIAIGMVTIYSSGGGAIARRLLSTEFLHKPINYEPDSGLNNEVHILEYHGRRNLLQTSQNSNSQLAPSMEQVSNALMLELDVPGYDSTSQLCQIYVGAPYGKCNILQFQTRIQGNNAMKICEENSMGTLSTTLDSGLTASLKGRNPKSEIHRVRLLQYDISGCAPTSTNGVESGNRRLLQTVTDGTFVVMTQKVIVSSTQGVSNLYLQSLNYLANFFNTTTWSSILGGGGYINYVNYEFTPTGENQGYVNISTYIVNGTKNVTQYIFSNLKKDTNTNGGQDVMFISDTDFNKLPKSGSISDRKPQTIIITLLINALTFASMYGAFV